MGNTNPCQELKYNTILDLCFCYLKHLKFASNTFRSQNNYHESLTLLLDFDVNAQDLHVVVEHLHVVG